IPSPAAAEMAVANNTRRDALKHIFSPRIYLRMQVPSKVSLRVRKILFPSIPWSQTLDFSGMTFDSLFRWIHVHVFLGDFKEFVHLLLRWTHVFAGILWVGTTYYFTWLDGRFSELDTQTGGSAADANRKCEKSIWMVHSGGFYRVEKQKTPSVMPEKLHWFKWEAALTWLTGILLFVLVYYHGK